MFVVCHIHNHIISEVAVWIPSIQHSAWHVILPGNICWISKWQLFPLQYSSNITFLLCFFPLVWTCDLVFLSGTWRHWINQLVWSIITVILIFVWEFPGEPMVRTLRFTAKGLDKIPACGARIPQAVQHGAPSPPPPPLKRRFLENVPMMI